MLNVFQAAPLFGFCSGSLASQPLIHIPLVRHLISVTTTSIQRPKKVAVIQSNYVPWVGYFAVMAAVDLFVVYECVQYTKNDWRNRNQIMSPDGRRTWLSIPVRQYSATQPFMQTSISRHDWAMSHFKTLQHHFARTQGWAKWRDELELLYKSAEKMSYLFDINRLFLKWTVSALKLSTQLVFLDSHPEFSDPTERLVSILKKFGATHYLSGPVARNYIDQKQFDAAQILLDYVDYDILINEMLISSQPVKTTSILQLILEGHHEFKNH